MTTFPRSLIKFQLQLPDGAACGYLLKARWPDGFVCPGCGNGRAWELRTKPWMWAVYRLPSADLGEHAPSCTVPSCRWPPWFSAAYLMATHSNGYLGTCNCNASSLSACTSGLADLHQGLVAPNGNPLAGLVHETEVACRTKHGPVPRSWRTLSPGMIIVVGAVEVKDGGPGRICLVEVPNYSAGSLHPSGLNLPAARMSC